MYITMSVYGFFIGKFQHCLFFVKPQHSNLDFLYLTIFISLATILLINNIKKTRHRQTENTALKSKRTRETKKGIEKRKEKATFIHRWISQDGKKSTEKNRIEKKRDKKEIEPVSNNNNSKRKNFCNLYSIQKNIILHVTCQLYE